jgi:hypothetical protein
MVNLDQGVNALAAQSQARAQSLLEQHCAVYAVVWI